ncbi:MAG: amidohydrolase family protein [Lentisphaeria bacterium]|nr:amidohydrolase family protein [Lentisphaeria bacterium]
MKIIDAHNHPDWLGHDLARTLENMDQYGISQAWLLSHICPRHEHHQVYFEEMSGAVLGMSDGPTPFARCLSCKERAPERFILGYSPDPREREASRMLVAANKIYGAKICGEVKIRTMYDSPDCIRLFRTAGELGMPVVMHFDYDRQTTYKDPWTEWYGGTIYTLERVLQACPDTIFLGHAPGFWIHISNDDLWKTNSYPNVEKDGIVPGGEIIRLLRTYPNLYCDISAGSGRMALSRDKNFTKAFLTEFQDRILYARDCFDNKHQELLNSLDLPESILEKIYSGNAMKLVP